MYPTNSTSAETLASPLLQELAKHPRCSKNSYSPQLGDNSKNRQRYSSSSKTHSNDLIGSFGGFFKFIETKYQRYSAQIYMIALNLVICILLKIQETLLSDMDKYETIGFGLILAFMLNLFLTERRIFQEKKPNFHFVKDAIILLGGSVIFFIYGLQILPLNMALSICYSACVIVILLETMISEKEFSVGHLLLAICAYIGVVLVLVCSNDEGAMKISNFWLLYGITIVGISAIFLAGFFIKFSKVTESNLLLFKGSLAMISVLAIIINKNDFKWPNLSQFPVLVIFAVLIYVGFIFLARSLQLTGAGEISPYFLGHVTMSSLFGWLFGGRSGLTIEAAGSLITQGSLIIHMFSTPKVKETEVNVCQLDSTVIIELTERSLNTTTYN